MKYCVGLLAEKRNVWYFFYSYRIFFSLDFVKNSLLITFWNGNSIFYISFSRNNKIVKLWIYVLHRWIIKGSKIVKDYKNLN